MSAKLTLFCLCLLALTNVASAARLQGPAGEVINRPPPVDDRAAARAEHAARLRRQAAIADQVELALKSGNAAMDRFLSASGVGGSESVRQESLSEAEADYQRAAKLQPSDWRAPSGLGDVFYFENRYGDSELAYKRAITLAPKDPQLHSLLARTYEAEYVRTPEGAAAKRQHIQAERLRALERAVALDPLAKHHYAYTNLASAYDYLKVYDKAIATGKRLLALLPRSDVKTLEDAHYQLATVYEHAQRFSEAIDEYKEAIRLNPDWSIYYQFLGRAYGEAKRYSEAIAAYQEANRLRPDPDNDVRIAEVYVGAQEYDKAIEVLSRATQLRPGNFEAVATLGYVYYLEKQYTLSLEPFQKAMRIRADVDGIHYYLGLSQLMLGHKSEAMEQYEELRKLKSDFADKLLSEINKQ